MFSRKRHNEKKKQFERSTHSKKKKKEFQEVIVPGITYK